MEDLSVGWRDWPHAPPHRLAASGVYMVTARARDRRHLLDSEPMKDFFTSLLLQLSADFGWRLEAWCVLSNHYHLVAHSPGGDADNLGAWLAKLHSLTTKERNRIDDCPGRTRLWHNFRDTHLTHPRSYLARLNYVHSNAVRHGLVAEPSQWPWSSAAAFERAVSPARARTIYSFECQEIAEADDD